MDCINVQLGARRLKNKEKLVLFILLYSPKGLVVNEALNVLFAFIRSVHYLCINMFIFIKIFLKHIHEVPCLCYTEQFNRALL